METLTIYRKANITTAEARKSLKRAYRGAKIASVDVVAADKDAARAAGVQVGDLVYEAVVHVAEFPPSDDSDSDSDSGDSAPAPPKKDKGGDSDSDSDDDDDSDDDSGDSGGGGGNPFGDKSDGGDKGLKGDEGIIHLLTEILHALKGGAGPDAGLGGPGDLPGGHAAPPPDLPDVGAPPAGGPPLPPPVKEKSPVGGPAFAHYDPSKDRFSVLRQDVTATTKTSALVAEAHELYPTHKVARLQRTGSAKVNGIEVNLPSNGFAVVTLVRR